MDEHLLKTQVTKPLLAWYDLYGRKDLPWQTPRQAYPVWISEIMLQQTQVQTVLPYFQRFMQHFPHITALALASEDEVLSLWSGLGYYSRARNIHHAAKIIQKEYAGCFPNDFQTLLQLPGIGPSTAAAILSQAFNQPTAVLDGNVQRVLTRFFLIEGIPQQASVKKRLWTLAQACMSHERCADYTQAIMDLGALCCTSKTPQCNHCPLQADCLAFKHQVQEQYPNKKIKKPVPVRSQKFLVLYDEQGQIYLEKRPPSGLWGGLWCLPSLDCDHCPLDMIQKNYALKGETPQPLLRMKHHFTHFHLDIDALCIKTSPLTQTIAQQPGRWFSKETLSALGLAKPTSRILSQFFQ